MTSTLAGILAAASLAYLLAGAAWLARRKPGYSHWRDTLSELGETGSTVERAARYALFLPIGLAFAAAAALAWGTLQQPAWAAACVATGYLAAVAFPCDAGSPAVGSWRQGLHNLGGAVEYLGGGLCLMRLEDDGAIPWRIVGICIFVAGILLGLMPAGSPRGAVQRVAECTLFGAVAYTMLAHSQPTP